MPSLFCCSKADLFFPQSSFFFKKQLFIVSKADVFMFESSKTTYDGLDRAFVKLIGLQAVVDLKDNF